MRSNKATGNDILMRFLCIVMALALLSCGQKKVVDEPAVEKVPELSPRAAWEKRAEEQRAWQSVEGLFIGNATYFESTGHFLVPLDFKEGIGSFEAVEKLFALKKPTPIYESPYQTRWQIVNEGRQMIEIPEFKDPVVFKMGSTEAIPTTPFKMEFYQSMVDAKVAQSFSSEIDISEPDAEYFFINKKASFKTSVAPPVLSDQNELELRQVALDHSADVEILGEKEFVDANDNYFGFITFKGESGNASFFYFQLYGETQRLVMASDLEILDLQATHLLVSEQPVFIAKIGVVGRDYTMYRPIYLRNFNYYHCALSGFLKD